jgi:membrane dipeptidase
LGGARNLGFGSDFDGISRTIVGLEDSSQTENWVNLLLRHYPEEVVKGFLSENWIQFMKRIWS